MATPQKLLAAMEQSPRHSPVPPPHPLHSAAEIAELAGGLAHELRNPLSTIMINLKLLAEDLQDQAVHPDDMRRRALLKVDVLRREAERLQGLFDAFLNLAGPCHLQAVEIDLRQVVHRLFEFIDPFLKSCRVNLIVSVPQTPVTVVADEKLLGQALINLVINAQQAMSEGGDLHLTTGCDDRNAFIAVSDTGVGIAEEDFERVLRPFFSTKARGSGLGLSITQRIVHEHKGTLTLSSSLGRGTTFTIRIPRNPPRSSDRQKS